MAKNIKGYVKLTIPAGAATPAPPVGPALGQKKVNIMEFCKAFNAATQDKKKGTPLPAVITVYEDNSFTFIVKTPPASFYLKEFANIKKGSSATKKEAFIGSITLGDCRKIAELKMPDLNTRDIEAAAKIICGTAISMGLEVVSKG